MPPTDATLPGEETIVEIRTTFASRPDAEACATRLVSERLAACVQVEGPVMSVYRWQGTVESAEEFRCTCKTTLERSAACIARIVEGHAYQTPELIMTRASASAAYAAWVRDGVQPE